VLGVTGVAVRHVGIVVVDLDRALGFYRDLLGLAVAREMDEGGEYLARITALPGATARTVKLAAPGGGMVELLRFTSHPGTVGPEPSAAAPGCSHVAFTVDDVEALHARLTAAGVRFHAPPQISPDGGARVAYCRDPEGTIVELVEVLARPR
jgi:catechol 2,3-dioxygenase-like lactoylglutathione lyase family enzyme